MNEKIKDQPGSVVNGLPSIPQLNNEPIQRRRKGGAVPILGASSMTAAKMAIVLAVCTGVGIAGAIVNYYTTKDLAAQRAAQRKADQARAAALASARRASVSGDASNLPVDRTAGGDSLGMFNNANRGDFPGDAEQAAAEAAAAQAAAQNAAGGDQSAPNASAAPSGGSNSAPNQNIGGSNSLGGSRIGQLSSGGGSSGHSGMSGGGGMASGIGRGFDPLGGAGGGDLLAMARSANPTMGKTGTSRPVSVSRGGANLARLGTMNSAMKPTTAMGDMQRASQIQSDQWSSGQTTPGAGNAITGSGDTAGGAGVGSGADAPAPSDGPGMSGGTASNNPAPQIAQTANSTPWQGMLDLAQTLLMISAGLVVLAGILTLKAMALMNPAFGAFWTIAKILDTIATILAAAVLTIGLIIMTQYGQMAQGLTLILGAGGVMAAALTNMLVDPVSGVWAILGGAMGFASAWAGKAGAHRTSNNA